MSVLDKINELIAGGADYDKLALLRKARDEIVRLSDGHKEAAALDLLLYGNSFMLDGVRIDPARVKWTANPLRALVEAKRKKLEETKLAMANEPNIFAKSEIAARAGELTVFCNELDELEAALRQGERVGGSCCSNAGTFACHCNRFGTVTTAPGMVPQGWRIERYSESSGELIVQGPNGGTPVSEDRGPIANRTLFGLAQALLAGTPINPTEINSKLIPPGMVLVPREPTEAMLEALHDEIGHEVQVGLNVDDNSTAEVSILDASTLPDAYRAMLAAAPAAQGASNPPNAWISDNDLLKLHASVEDARNIRMSTSRNHLRVHPVWIPALAAALGQEVGRG